ncbi:MAG: sugar phosphate isomerase/epimerase [Planctomycetales bacterium]|nr:sugar phosphate isomerase/epimerase [Planctomycetales bacterium]
MRLGYNTNGLAHHDPIKAIALLADIGYQTVALTLDHGTLNPFADDWFVQRSRLKCALDGWGMRSVIETGARFLLDHRLKHEPTLVSVNRDGRERRIQFLKRAVDAAEFLGSDCVSLWSGVVRDAAVENETWARLVPALQEVLDYAHARGVIIGFEPEPGMFIDTMARFAELQQRLNAPNLKLTLDVGHLHCQGEIPIADQITKWQDQIVNVHIEDMRAGIHEHLMFGEGEMDFPPILGALHQANYHGGIHVELSRHSHEGPLAAQRAYDFLAPLLAGE